jgi:hypothetical protein
MRLTRGERWALLCYALVVLGFMPPVISWVNRVEPLVLGVPFFYAWAGIMTLATSGLMTIAFFLRERLDRK